MSRAEDLVADLADLYEWNVTPGGQLALVAALRGHTRAFVSQLAGEIAKANGGQLTLSQLAKRLGEINRGQQVDPRAPEPNGVDVAGVPTHPIDCQCEGTGVLVEVGALALVDPDTGEKLSARSADRVTPCPANGGRRMTRHQWERHQNEAAVTGRPVAARSFDEAASIGRAGIAAARAALDGGGAA